MRLLVDLSQAYSCQLLVTTDDKRVLPHQVSLTITESLNKPVRAELQLFTESGLKDNVRFHPNDKSLRWQGEILRDLDIVKLPRWRHDEAQLATVHCAIKGMDVRGNDTTS